MLRTAAELLEWGEDGGRRRAGSGRWPSGRRSNGTPGSRLDPLTRRRPGGQTTGPPAVPAPLSAVRSLFTRVVACARRLSDFARVARLTGPGHDRCSRDERPAVSQVPPPPRQTKAVMPPDDPVLASAVVSSAARPAGRPPARRVASPDFLPLHPLWGCCRLLSAADDAGAAFTVGPDRRPRRQLPPPPSPPLCLARALRRTRRRCGGRRRLCQPDEPTVVAAAAAPLDVCVVGGKVTLMRRWLVGRLADARGRPDGRNGGSFGRLAAVPVGGVKQYRVAPRAGRPPDRPTVVPYRLVGRPVAAHTGGARLATVSCRRR